MRVGDGKVSREPYASREACLHGHEWTSSTTRWRIRRDKGEHTPTRDCLACRYEARQARRGAATITTDRLDRSDEAML